ncbi:MAG: hypothetical protein WA211_12430 [Candidatus Acidiferrales bacterium]
MKSAKVYRTGLILLVFFAMPAAAIAQSGCSQIFEHGIFNTASTDSLELRTRSFVNWLSQSTFVSYGATLDAARRLGFSIDGLPLQIGGHARASDWRNYQASLQTLDMSDKRNLARFSQIVDAADQGIAKAWQACLLTSKGVSHAVIELSYDPFKFKVRLMYDAVGALPSTKILDFTLTPDSAACTPPIHSDTTLQSSGLVLNCMRQSASDAIRITGNTDKGPLLAELPGLTPPSLVATKLLEPPLGPPPGGCTADNKGNRSIDKKTQDGNQPVYVCP